MAASPSETEPVAMVEHVANGPDSLSNFDYLYPGRVIDLGSDGSLSLIYFQTCLREDIRGGLITIQEDESDVRGSNRLSRKFAECGVDVRHDQHGDRRTSAAMVFRGHAPIQIIDHLAPRFVLPDEADWISVTEIPSMLEIFRLHPSGTTVDLNDHGLILRPGRAYRVESNDRYVVLRVESDAEKKRGAKVIAVLNSLIDEIADEHR